MGNDTITVHIPVYLVESIVHAIENHASWFREDEGHSPDDLKLLREDADRLDAIAEDIRLAYNARHASKES